jgi:hypothetical protein
MYHEIYYLYKLLDVFIGETLAKVKIK